MRAGSLPAFALTCQWITNNMPAGASHRTYITINEGGSIAHYCIPNIGYCLEHKVPGESKPIYVEVDGVDTVTGFTILCKDTGTLNRFMSSIGIS